MGLLDALKMEEHGPGYSRSIFNFMNKLFDVRITRGTKRVGEIFTVNSLREINHNPPGVGFHRSEPIIYYVIWIDGIETVLDPCDCEVIKPLNILEL